ncbi:hypothetical protein Tco_1262626 [Tanacetum coccineum]|uniref:Uncharacterized protein n=1 Tax=Tanacetum coccineum TaxID=301880 RepID=A0ABQ5EAX0_9ASTR
MAIPDPLITEAIRQSSYYPMYLKMVAENTKKTPQEVQACNQQQSVLLPKSRQPPHQSNKPSQLLLHPRNLPSVSFHRKLERESLLSNCIDEEDEAQQESIPQREDDDPDLELAKKLSLETPQEKGEGEGDDADLERAIKLSFGSGLSATRSGTYWRSDNQGSSVRSNSQSHEVVGKGKAVVTEEQVAHSLVDLSKKKRTTDQFVLVRRDQTPPDSTTGPSSQPEDYTSRN